MKIPAVVSLVGSIGKLSTRATCAVVANTRNREMAGPPKEIWLLVNDDGSGDPVVSLDHSPQGEPWLCCATKAIAEHAAEYQCDLYNIGPLKAVRYVLAE